MRAPENAYSAGMPVRSAHDPTVGAIVGPECVGGAAHDPLGYENLVSVPRRESLEMCLNRAETLAR